MSDLLPQAVVQLWESRWGLISPAQVGYCQLNIGYLLTWTCELIFHWMDVPQAGDRCKIQTIEKSGFSWWLRVNALFPSELTWNQCFGSNTVTLEASLPQSLYTRFRIRLLGIIHHFKSNDIYTDTISNNLLIAPKIRFWICIGRGGVLCFRNHPIARS